jgi:hypothetical protein
MVPDPLLIAAWIAAEILRWTSGEGCERTMLQATTKTAKVLARDENIIIRRQKIALATGLSLINKFATLENASCR